MSGRSSRQKKGGAWVLAAWIILMAMLVIGGMRGRVPDEAEESESAGPVESPGVSAAHSAGTTVSAYEPPQDRPLAVGEPFRVQDGVIELKGAAGRIEVAGDTNEAPILIVEALPASAGRSPPAGGKK